VKINEATISDIVRRGDSTTAAAIIRTMIHCVNVRETQRRLQVRTTNKLRTAFMETETDRDRLRRMVGALVRLCERNGISEECLAIVESYGGIEGSKEDPREVSTAF